MSRSPQPRLFHLDFAVREYLGRHVIAHQCDCSQGFTLDLMEAVVERELYVTDMPLEVPQSPPQTQEAVAALACKWVTAAATVCGWGDTHWMTMFVARRQERMLTSEGRSRELARNGIERLRRGGAVEFGADEATALVRYVAR